MIGTSVFKILSVFVTQSRNILLHEDIVVHRGRIFITKALLSDKLRLSLKNPSAKQEINQAIIHNYSS